MPNFILWLALAIALGGCASSQPSKERLDKDNYPSLGKAQAQQGKVSFLILPDSLFPMLASPRPTPKAVLAFCRREGLARTNPKGPHRPERETAQCLHSQELGHALGTISWGRVR